MNIKAIARTYPIDKPRPSLQLIALSTISICGLTALFFAAFASFRISTGNEVQAFFAALLIEVGLVVEAIALINKPKTIYPWVGLLIAFVVSGTYNWHQAHQHTIVTRVEISSWTLFALAFGPLSALGAISLTLGSELREYQKTISSWELARAEWARNEAKRLERKAERAESRKRLPEEIPVTVSNNGKSSGNLPAWLPVEPENVSQFRQMVISGTIILPPGLTGNNLTCIGAVKSDRTGRNWLKAVGYRDIEH